MVFLVKMEIGYRTQYFKFDDLNTTLVFVLRMKATFIGVISDDTDLKVTIEVLTTNEYEEMIEEEK